MRKFSVLQYIANRHRPRTTNSLHTKFEILARCIHREICFFFLYKSRVIELSKLHTQSAQFNVPKSQLSNKTNAIQSCGTFYTRTQLSLAENSALKWQLAENNTAILKSRLQSTNVENNTIGTRNISFPRNTGHKNRPLSSSDVKCRPFTAH